MDSYTLYTLTSAALLALELLPPLLSSHPVSASASAPALAPTALALAHLTSALLLAILSGAITPVAGRAAPCARATTPTLLVLVLRHGAGALLGVEAGGRIGGGVLGAGVQVAVGVAMAAWGVWCLLFYEAGLDGEGDGIGNGIGIGGAEEEVGVVEDTDAAAPKGGKGRSSGWLFPTQERVLQRRERRSSRLKSGLKGKRGEGS